MHYKNTFQNLKIHEKNFKCFFFNLFLFHLKSHYDNLLIYCKTVPTGLFIMIMEFLAKIKKRVVLKQQFIRNLPLS